MQLKIWHKMIIGISIPSLIVLIGGLLSYGYINDVKNRQGFVQLADDLKKHVLEIRRNEKNFLLHRDVRYYNFLRDALAAMKKVLANIPHETVNEIGENNFLLIRNSLQEYSNIINALHTQFQQENESLEKVREEGKKLEAFVSQKRISSELSVDFIMNLRRLEKNYMLLRDKDSYEELDNALKQIKNIIPFCFECVPYTKSVYRLSEAYNQSDSMISELQIMGENFEKNAYRIAEMERKKINDFLDRTHRLLLMALILLCTLGPLLVYKTATYIVAPIKRLADITNKIAEGDLTLRAPLKEHDETYALALSFNKMLDRLQATHQSFEKSLRLLNEQQPGTGTTEFLSSEASRELNNSAEYISQTAETIKKDLNELSPEKLLEYIQEITIRSELIRNILTDLKK